MARRVCRQCRELRVLLEFAVRRGWGRQWDIWTNPRRRGRPLHTYVLVSRMHTVHPSTRADSEFCTHVAGQLGARSPESRVPEYQIQCLSSGVHRGPITHKAADGSSSRLASSAVEA